MKYHLKSYNDEGVIIDDQTIHSSVLSEHDGLGDVNSMTLYFHSIKLTLFKAGVQTRKWPTDWVRLSVSELAEQLMPE